MKWSISGLGWRLFDFFCLSLKREASQFERGNLREGGNLKGHFQIQYGKKFKNTFIAILHHCHHVYLLYFGTLKLNEEIKSHLCDFSYLALVLVSFV